jgi:hypothetical protein
VVTAEGVEQQKEDWGEIDLAALPNPNDMIEVIHQDSSQRVEVRWVHHLAVKHPLPETESPVLQRTEPAVHIIARWYEAD